MDARHRSSEQEKDRLARQKSLNRVVDAWIQKRHKNVCKPCWEINYCPYGPLVELLPPYVPTQEAIRHNDFLVQQVRSGAYDNDKRKKKEIQKDISMFDPDYYPINYSRKEKEKFCTVFGHVCPVFMVSEPLTETGKLRRVSRRIPRHVMIRVGRRDNSTCQVCARNLLDNEIQFDHIVPITRGGPSEESNVRVICGTCNRAKSAKVEFADLWADNER